MQTVVNILWLLVGRDAVILGRLSNSWQSANHLDEVRVAGQHVAACVDNCKTASATAGFNV